ncbi:hypothetical protein CY658_02715 [Variovorax sp. RO1]|nr:hypothetical protein CY658_02715 [Variovorax sp. RO1]
MPQQRPLGHILSPFRDREVYVLAALHESQCHYVTEVVPEGDALLCFLSLIDAHIERAFRTMQGQGLQYRVMAGSTVPVGRLAVPNGLLMASLHLAWLTKNRRLMVRPSGTPCQYVRSLVLAPTPSAPCTFEVDDGSLAAVDRLHESGGLFSWCEINDTPWSWEPAGLYKLAERAVRSSQAFVHPGGAIDNYEFGLFDPEFEQWHFVPSTVAE